MKKSIYVATALVLALTWARPAAADTILFDPNGAIGGDNSINAVTFDWAPGNSLIQEHLGGPILTATLLYQANLATVQTTTSPAGDFLNCSLGALSCITALASFEVVLTPTGPNSSTYTVIPGSGQIKIYADNETGNNLTGLGFALDPGAIEILSATLTSGSGNNNFSDLTPVDMDQFLSALGAEPAGNNYPGQFTYSGQGATDVQALVNTFNPNYFRNLVANSSIAMTNTSQIDPYNQANPSAFFSSNAIADGNVLGVGSVGPINGAGFNIMAQSDGNSSIRQPSVIPEPATLGLFGLGLAGTAVAARRRQRKAQRQA